MAHSWLAVWVLPLGFVIGLTFGAFGLVMNSLAPGYDFFTYFFTLVLTPTLLLSGVFFPGRANAPCAAHRGRDTAAFAWDRHRAPLLSGKVPDNIVFHIAVLLAYACAAYYVALVLTRAAPLS